MTEIPQPIPGAPSASGECIEHPMQLLTGWINPATERELVTLRRDIHREPEPGWAEFISTARLAKYFRRAGFEVRYGPEFIRDDLIRGRDMAETRRGIARAKAAGIDAETLERMGSIPGLLAVWDSGRPGKTVAIRVELDAVYVDEPKTAGHIPAEKGFASRRRGLMHACGHDAHQAAAAHLARFVHANAGRLDGKVMFLCQPAEEGSRGAYPIVQSGALDGVDVLLCAHVAVDIPAGTVVAAPEKFLCTTKIDLEFTGTPSHAGMQPQLGRNALLAAANVAVNLMALPRHADGMTRVNVGSLHAGEGRNIVPSHAVMEVEVRGENEAINRDLAREALERASGMAAAFGVKLRHSIVGEAVDFVPDDSIAQLITVCARRARYCRTIEPEHAANSSDDGTLLMRRVQEQGGRAGYFMVGGAFPSRAASAAVDFDEHAVVTLYDIYANLIIALLGRWN